MLSLINITFVSFIWPSFLKILFLGIHSYFQLLILHTFSLFQLLCGKILFLVSISVFPPTFSSSYNFVSLKMYFFYNLNFSGFGFIYFLVYNFLCILVVYCTFVHLCLYISPFSFPLSPMFPPFCNSLSIPLFFPTSLYLYSISLYSIVLIIAYCLIDIAGHIVEMWLTIFSHYKAHNLIYILEIWLLYCQYNFTWFNLCVLHFFLSLLLVFSPIINSTVAYLCYLVVFCK